MKRTSTALLSGIVIGIVSTYSIALIAYKHLCKIDNEVEKLEDEYHNDLIDKIKLVFTNVRSDELIEKYISVINYTKQVFASDYTTIRNRLSTKLDMALSDEKSEKTISDIELLIVALNDFSEYN